MAQILTIAPGLDHSDAQPVMPDNTPDPRISRWVRHILNTPDEYLLGQALGNNTDADHDLWALARALRTHGLIVEGHIQLRGATQGDCNCREMHLVNLRNDHRTQISEDRGPRARGCHLDWAALTNAADRLGRCIDDRTDLVIVNRFGRAEAEGAGMRGVISDALMSGVRVLVGYRPEYAEAWAAFHDGIACDIPK